MLDNDHDYDNDNELPRDFCTAPLVERRENSKTVCAPDRGRDRDRKSSGCLFDTDPDTDTDTDTERTTHLQTVSGFPQPSTRIRCGYRFRPVADQHPCLASTSIRPPSMSADIDKDNRVRPASGAEGQAPALAEGPIPTSGQTKPAHTAQTASASYRLAYTDGDFLSRQELRPARLQLELLKAELLQQEQGIESTVVIFGSTRIPEPEAARERLRAAQAAAAADPDNRELTRQAAVAKRIADKSRYYDEARRLAAMITRVSQHNGHRHYVIVTGGGPGLMEAANRGASDVGGKSIGLSIVLPHEERPNPYVTPELCFQFQYFAIRKMHFLLRARALVAFPGGFGTLDELFETLTLIQTGKVRPVPVVLFGRAYWERVIDLDAMVEEGTIDPKDRDLIQFAERAEDAWALIRDHYVELDWHN
jgi:uncharacterized protein (TIGR00730 family)